MAKIKELIIKGEGNSVSFGDYSLDSKAKKEGFSFGGDIYKVKTFKDVTKLEKNESFLYESVPGSSVMDFTETEKGLSFTAFGKGDVSVTLELSPDTEYTVSVGSKDPVKMSTKSGGKLFLSLDLNEETGLFVSITK